MPTGSRPDDATLADAIVAGPLGACALHHLERGGGADAGWVHPIATPDEAAIGRAVDRVRRLPWAEVVVDLAAASGTANPWIGDRDTPRRLVAEAEARRPIAEALVAAHGDALCAPADPTSQETWLHAPAWPRFGDLGRVYECGEWPWGGLRTWDRIAEATHDVWSHARDGAHGDRWLLGMRADAEIHEIVLPADWTALVAAHPRRTHPFTTWPSGAPGHVTSLHNAWEVEPVAIGPDGRATLDCVDGTRLTGVRGMVQPDWTAVAQSADAVHLTWAGLLTTEASVTLRPDGWLTVLRYWATEQTVWLRDCVVTAELGAPPRVDTGVLCSAHEADRTAHEQVADLRIALGPDTAAEVVLPPAT